MKKQLLVIAFLLFTSTAYGQKFGYIDSEFILSKMPDYSLAQKQLDKMAEDWQKEVQNLRMEIRSMYDALQAEDILLTREMREERLKEIRIKEKEAEDFQTSIFGPNGNFFVKQQELMKPVMEKIFDACRKVSAKNRLDFLFDKSGDIVMIFTNPRHDYTDFVLEELGLLDPKNPKN